MPSTGHHSRPCSVCLEDEYSIKYTYRCKKCGISFFWVHSLYEHQKLVHGPEPIKQTHMLILWVRLHGFAAWWLWWAFYLANLLTLEKKLRAMRTGWLTCS